jgi:hypothetical protein
MRYWKAKVGMSVSSNHRREVDRLWCKASRLHHEAPRIRSSTLSPSQKEMIVEGQSISMKDTSVSIVLGSNNRNSFLEATIKSIRNNSISVPYEIIVVDGFRSLLLGTVIVLGSFVKATALASMAILISSPFYFRHLENPCADVV